jgi:type I restriction enzyme M protein
LSRLGSPNNLAKRSDTGEEGRFRCFSRDWIADRGDNLAISWLKDENGIAVDDLPEPEILAEQAMGELEAALEELRGILAELVDEEAE